jgi:soluble lytic murein transglycosylase-like protein
MIDNMYTVMKRINEIRSRFGLRSHWPANLSAARRKPAGFQDMYARALDGREPDRGRASANEPSAIKGKTVDEIKKLADYYATASKVPPGLVKAVIETESGFNPRALSTKGAKGLMQLMPSVISSMGVRDPYDPNENINAGVNMLKTLLKNYNWDYKKALAAYNAGESAVDARGGVPEYDETREFVKKVINAYIRNSD